MASQIYPNCVDCILYRGRMKDCPDTKKTGGQMCDVGLLDMARRGYRFIDGHWGKVAVCCVDWGEHLPEKLMDVTPQNADELYRDSVRKYWTTPLSEREDFLKNEWGIRMPIGICGQCSHDKDCPVARSHEIPVMYCNFCNYVKATVPMHLRVVKGKDGVDGNGTEQGEA